MIRAVALLLLPCALAMIGTKTEIVKETTYKGMVACDVKDACKTSDWMCICQKLMWVSSVRRAEARNFRRSGREQGQRPQTRTHAATEQPGSVCNDIRVRWSPADTPSPARSLRLSPSASPPISHPRAHPPRPHLPSPPHLVHNSSTQSLEYKSRYIYDTGTDDICKKWKEDKEIPDDKCMTKVREMDDDRGSSTDSVCVDAAP